MMFRWVFIFFCLFFSCSISSFAEDTVLSAEISINEQVPSDLMGSWRVVSHLMDTDSPDNFKEVGVVVWNLSRSGNVITLCSLFTGAQASVNVEYVKDNTVRFTKEGNYEGKNLIDTVEITINGDTFTGNNYLKLRNFSDVNGSIISEKTATYSLVGKKISGSGIMY